MKVLYLLLAVHTRTNSAYRDEPDENGRQEGNAGDGCATLYFADRG